MDRVEIKNKAKEMIKDNKWYLWKPQVMVSLVIFAISFVISLIVTLINEDAGKVAYIIIGVITSLFESAFAIAYAKYVLEFIRGNKMDWKETITLVKEHFGIYLLVSILVGLIICGASILLVIPGIIASIGLMFYQEVCADNPKLSAMEVVKKSWEITKGHKMDLFVMGLSFIGWAMLASLTFGILYIWLMPYMYVAFALAYEKIKK